MAFEHRYDRNNQALSDRECRALLECKVAVIGCGGSARTRKRRRYRFDADRHRVPTEFPQEAPLRAEVGDRGGFGGSDRRTPLLHPLPWQPSRLSPSDEGVFPVPSCCARLACRHRDEIPCPRPRNREGNARCHAGCLRADCFRPDSPCGSGFLNSTAMCWAYRMRKRPSLSGGLLAFRKSAPGVLETFEQIRMSHASHSNFAMRFPLHLAMRPSRYVGDNSRSIGLPPVRRLRQAGNPPPLFPEE